MNERFPVLPPVHQAALRGDLAALETLHAQGADLDARCDPRPWYGPLWRGVTPLMLAAHSAEGADVGTLRWLLAHGADLRATSAGGATAAWYAVWDGAGWVSRGSRDRHHERLAFLLEAGLDAGERLPDGQTLVSEVAGRADVASLRLLLARGAPVVPTWGKADTQRERDEMRRMLRGLGGEGGARGAGEEDGFLEGTAVEHIGDAPPEHAIPLHAAARAACVECVRLLLDAGAPRDQVDSDGRTALFLAGSGPIVDVLVAAGADPGRLGGPRLYDELSRHDALDHVLRSEHPGRFEVAQALLTHGAPLERAAGASSSRLHDAAFRRDADAVAWLLGRGTRPGPDSWGGRTPLHAVCWQGQMADAEMNAAGARIVRLLVAAGNPLAARDGEGLAPMDDAVDGDWAYETAVETLLALGAPPDEPGPGGVTPLMRAARQGEVACVRLLLAAGADPTRTDEAGGTAVDHARERHRIWVQLLAEASPEEVERRTSTLAEAVETLRALGARPGS